MTATADLLDEHPDAAGQHPRLPPVRRRRVVRRRDRDRALLRGLDVPVTFGGVTFHPGARVASDDDGIVTL